jgi:hypothetical protein
LKKIAYLQYVITAKESNQRDVKEQAHVDISFNVYLSIVLEKPNIQLHINNYKVILLLRPTGRKVGSNKNTCNLSVCQVNTNISISIFFDTIHNGIARGTGMYQSLKIWGGR